MFLGRNLNNLIRDNIATMVAVLITVISLGAFFIQFHSGLSNEQSDWGALVVILVEFLLLCLHF